MCHSVEKRLMGKPRRLWVNNTEKDVTDLDLKHGRSGKGHI